MDYKKVEINGKTVYNCQGYGQCSCRRCTDNGKWSRSWTPDFYKLTPDDDEPCYCRDCIKEVLK